MTECCTAYCPQKNLWRFERVRPSWDFQVAAGRWDGCAIGFEVLLDSCLDYDTETEHTQARASTHGLNDYMGEPVTLWARVIFGQNQRDLGRNIPITLVQDLILNRDLAQRDSKPLALHRDIRLPCQHHPAHRDRCGRIIRQSTTHRINEKREERKALFPLT
jgi:hypothetical protein